MNTFIEKIFLLLILIFFTQNCSTATTILDTATSTTINTTKGIAHYTTCPFTKKDCF